MTTGHLDTTIYAAQVANAASQVKISSTVFKNFIADVKDKNDSNYDMSVAITQQSIINGNFSINQRVVSGTVTLAAGAYGHDRWKAGASGCTYTFATSGNITTITISAGSLIQVIEGVNLFTDTYTLSWTGTAQGKIGAGSYGATGITGSATGGTNLNIEFNTGTLSQVQFNVGSVTVPFQPRGFAEELALCKRYYEKSYDYAAAPGTSRLDNLCTGVAVDSGIIAPYIYFKVRKRIDPTLTIYSSIGTVGQVSIVGTQTDAGATGFSVLSGGDSQTTRISRSAGTALTAGALYWFAYEADAEI